MKAYNNISEIGDVKVPVLTIGTFDGVHLGHQKIIGQLIEKAKSIHGESVVLSFFPHPRMVLFPEQTDLKLINSLDEKINLLKATGVDHIIIHPFTKEFGNLSAEDFVKKFLVDTLKVKLLIIGYDHHFGKNREGGLEQLKVLGDKYGFEIEEISRQTIDDNKISSTRVRKSLQSGDIESANRYLGYAFQMDGSVVKGDGRGRLLGYPTANIVVEEQYKLVPAKGVYAVRVITSSGQYNGMLNIGHRPTFQGKDVSIEVNLFDFDQDLYHQTVSIVFEKRLRNEMKFESVEQLQNQLAVDKELALKALS